jgi:hypothetical protein
LKVSAPWLYVECVLTFGTSRSLGITHPHTKRPPKTEKKYSYHGSSSTMAMFLNSHNNTGKKYKRPCISIGQVGSRTHGQCKCGTYFVIFSMVFCICPHKRGPQGTRSLVLGCVGEYSRVMCAFAPFSSFPHLLKPLQSLKSFIQNLMVCFLLLWKTLNLIKISSFFFSVHSNWHLVTCLTFNPWSF